MITRWVHIIYYILLCVDVAETVRGRQHRRTHHRSTRNRASDGPKETRALTIRRLSGGEDPIVRKSAQKRSSDIIL